MKLLLSLLSLQTVAQAEVRNPTTQTDVNSRLKAPKHASLAMECHLEENGLLLIARFP